MKIKFYSLIVLVLAIISLSGCVSRKQVQFYQGIDNLAESQIYDNDKIRIKPDDRLVIRIFSTNQEAATPFNPMIISRSGGGGGANQSIEYMVSRSGTINFPVLGEIKAEGYNVIEFADKLEELISPYLANPVAMVRIQNFMVSFIGAVNGSINVEDDQINLSQAISRVGGINNQGKIDNILVIREKNGVRTQARLDLTSADVMESPFYYLEQNDIVYVEPTTPARQQRGYLGTIGSYIGIVSSVLSLIVIFTR